MKLPKNHHKNPRAASNPHPILRVPFDVGPAPQELTIERVGEDAFVAHVESYDLHLNAPGGTPRTRDIDLAAWLGFKQPRMIRKLIRRMEAAGKLRDLDVRDTVERTSMPHGGEREVAVQEFWLTREQALLVATQSDTPRAWALVEVMVKVFDGVLSMLHEPPANTIGREDIEKILAAAVAPLRDELAALRDRAAPALLGECIGRRAALEEIQKPVRALAQRLAAHDPLYSRRQHIGRLYIEMREAIGVSLAPRLEDFDAEMLRASRGWIRARNRGLERRDDASRGRRRGEAKAAQGTLGIN